jgi:hypothetical protein
LVGLGEGGVKNVNITIGDIKIDNIGLAERELSGV